MNDRGKKILKWVLDKGLREGWLYKQDREDIMEYWKAGTKCSCKGCETKTRLEEAEVLLYSVYQEDDLRSVNEDLYDNVAAYFRGMKKNGQEVGASAGRGEVGGSGDSVKQGGCACSPTKGVGC